jgi:hypothetical protein
MENKGKFKPGNAGKPKGAINKKTKDLREKVNEFLYDQWENTIETYNQLEAKDKLIFFERLLQYGLPKLQATNLEVEPNNNKITIRIE